MPVPKPRPNESQQAFVSRCIREMHHQDPDRPDDQIAAICYTAWRERGKGIDILSRLAGLRNRLIEVFGDLGRRYFNATLERLGIHTLDDGSLDLSVFKTADMAVPFAKAEGETVEFCNIPLFEQEFIKLDDSFNAVAAYANVAVIDCDLDLIFPSDYRASAEAYTRHPARVNFLHHRGMEAGDIVPTFTDKEGHVWKTAVNDIGWFVVSQPYDFAKELIKNGKLRAYSIGGRFTMRRRIGELWAYEPNSIQILDLSYVPNPCNRLCFLDLIKSDNYSYTDLPQACRCTSCGYVLNNPQSHCREIRCPKCGSAMRRIKSRSSTPTGDDVKPQGGQKMEELPTFAKEWIEQGLWNPADFDELGFNKQMTATQRERIPERLGTGGYACHVGDQWKLPIHDEAHTRNAMARYNQAEGCQTADVRGRICAAARHFNIEAAFKPGGFCHTGGKSMNKEELEGAKTELIKEFPDAEEKIRAVESQEEFDKLKEELQAKPKTAMEKYREALAKATTPEEMEAAKETYYKDKAFEEAKNREIEKAKKIQEDEEQRVINMLPKRVEAIEAGQKELSEKLDKFMEKYDQRLVKMEEAPAFKTGTDETGKDSFAEVEELVKSGGIDQAIDTVHKLAKTKR